jgi:hypothetical protein
VSWLIVVGGVIALALAVHFAEQRKSKALALARRARRASSEPHRFSLTREVKETWAIDLSTMTLTLTRSDEAAVAMFRLERGADGTWHMRPGAGSAAALAVPAAIAAQLEQRYQSVSGAVAPASG